MFKSLNIQSREEIIIIDRHWAGDDLDMLRSKGVENKLVCPECAQPVRVRAGEKNRRHFSHKSLDECPLRNEHASILSGRRIIYQWLKEKFQDKSQFNVTVEKRVETPALLEPFPRPIDCYVSSNNNPFSYWILKSGFRDRELLIHLFESIELEVNWVFVDSMLRFDSKNKKRVLLTPTERDLIAVSEYDQMYPQGEGSLHYLDIEDGMLITLRGLQLYHKPSGYKYGGCLISQLTDVLISPCTGEFIHHSEIERLKHYQEELKKEQRRSIKEEKAFRAQLFRKEKQCNPQSNIDSINNSQNISQNRPKSTFNLPEKIICSICGNNTKDWVTYNPNKCRECLEKQQNN